MRTFGLPEQIGLTPEERTAATARKAKRHEFHKKLWRRSLEIPKGEAHNGKLIGPPSDIMEGDRHRGGSWALVWRFLWFAKPYYFIIAVVFLLMIVAAGLQAALPVGFGYTIDTVLARKNLDLLSLGRGELRKPLPAPLRRATPGELDPKARLRTPPRPAHGLH